MTRRFVASIAAAILLLTPCSLAQAQPKLPSLGDDSSSSEPAKGVMTQAPSIEQLLDLIKKADGYSEAEIVTTSDNKTKFVRAKVNSVQMVVVPEVCSEGKCLALWFYTNLGKQKDVDLKWINAWNAKYLFGKVFLDKDGKMGFDMTIHFAAGVQAEYVTGSATVFAGAMKTLFSFKP
jgi:Putative bacterial sensory transduction regulator